MDNKENTSSKKNSLFDFFHKNVVFVSAIGIVPIVVGSTSLKNATAFSLLLFILIIGTYTVAALLPKTISQPYRIPIYATVSALCFIPAWFILPVFFPTFRDMMDIYLYVVVLDMLVIYQAEEFARTVSLGKAVLGAVNNWVGFAIVILLCGAIREIMASGTLWGNSIHNFKIQGATRPFFGFILLGLIGAGYSVLRSAIEEPKQRLPRKGRQKHRTLTEEILDNKEKESNEKKEDLQQDIPAAFRQAHAEARIQQQMKNQKVLATSEPTAIERNPEANMDQDTIEVIVPKIGKSEQGFRSKPSKEIDVSEPEKEQMEDNEEKEDL